MAKGSELVRVWPIEAGNLDGDHWNDQRAVHTDEALGSDDDHDLPTAQTEPLPKAGGGASLSPETLWGAQVDQAVLPEGVYDDPRALRQLRYLYARGQLGSNVVFICAEPGMGKSHLATQFISELESEGASVCTVSFGSCRKCWCKPGSGPFVRETAIA